MSRFAAKIQTPTSASRSPVEVGSAPPTADTTHASDAGTHLHTQNNGRVYQAAGNQYILGQDQPAPAAVNTLPRDTAAFTGRGTELDGLTSVVTNLVTLEKTIPVFAIDGMPGVGKTTFAVHVAHRLAAAFPDGQIFLDLHAHTAGKAPVDPAEALLALLSVEGVRASDVPEDVDGRSAQWRARMAGRRSILIIDNVDSHQQVEPLLPGAPSCLVLVTSRRRLTGLSARHAAAAVPLEPLPPGPAADLFTRLIGRGLEDQGRAVSKLVQLCGCLPLAISLLAARLRPEPQWRVEALVDELTAARNRVAHMRAEDIQVAAAFNLSYRCLPAARRRFFRRLGLNPGIDIDAYAAAALGDVDPATARRHLEALYGDHLLDQPVQGRYRLHDLLGAYARSLAASDGARQCDLALERLLDYYQHAVAAADRHFAPRPRPTTDSLSRFRGAVPGLVDAVQAAAWMEAELPNLLACVTHVLGQGDEVRLIGMSAALAAFLRRAGPYRQSITLHRAAAAAAASRGDRAARAAALYNVGVLLGRPGDYQAAIGVLAEARGLYRDLGDQVGEADALAVAGIVQRLAGDYLTAAEILNEALTRFRELADPVGQGDVLTELAAIRWRTDDHSAATKLLDQVLALYRRAGYRQGQAYALFQLGTVRRLTHDYPGATRALTQAMGLYRGLGARLGLAHTQHSLGAVHRLTGDYPGAARYLNESLRIYLDVGDRLGQANALRHLGIVRRLTGDYPGATSALCESLSLCQALGNRRDQAETLQELGVVRRLTGDSARAADDLAKALAILQDLGSIAGQAEVLNHIGALLLDDGDPEAPDRFQTALRLARQVRNPLQEAGALEGLARCSMRRHDTGQAVRQLQAARELYQRIDAPDVAQVTARLAALGRQPID